MAATASDTIHLGTGAGLARLGVNVHRAEGDVIVPRRRRPGRWKTVLTDSVALVGIVLSIPIAIALVGGPIALAIALLLWLGRLALGGF